MNNINIVGSVLSVPVRLIISNPFSFRSNFDDTELEFLANSVKTYGLIQPVTVKSLNNGYFQIISGERRLRAVKMCGYKLISCIVVDCDNYNSAVLSFIENTNRTDYLYSEKVSSLSFLQNKSFYCNDFVKNINYKAKMKMISDVRLFLNTFNSTVDTMNNAGITVNKFQNENEDFIEYNLKIYKKPKNFITYKECADYI